MYVFITCRKVTVFPRACWFMDVGKSHTRDRRGVERMHPSRCTAAATAERLVLASARPSVRCAATLHSRGQFVRAHWYCAYLSAHGCIPKTSVTFIVYGLEIKFVHSLVLLWWRPTLRATTQGARSLLATVKRLRTKDERIMDEYR